MLGMDFCFRIIIDGGPTLGVVRPTPSKQHYGGAAHTCSQCLACFFCFQIIIDGWSTVGLVSPTTSKKHYRGAVHTCLHCLAWFFVLKSLLTDGLHSAW